MITVCSHSLHKWTLAASLVLMCGGAATATAQDLWRNPALQQDRSANLYNGGMEWEFEYHRRTVLPSYQPKYVPISKFSGGAGYCCPNLRAPYYGCDRSRTGCR